MFFSRVLFYPAALLCGALISCASFGQTTEIFTIMQYNVLNYNNSTGQCNGSTNSVGAKDDNLKIVMDFAQPDIIALNELGPNFANGSRILDNVLNTDGTTSWKQAQFTNNGFSNLVNMLFYNSDLFELDSQVAIEEELGGSDLVRVIDIYTLYRLDPNLETNPDTVFMSFIVAHLKAGSSANDRDQRAAATEAVMDYLDNNPVKGNLFFVGDLNVQSSSETSFQNLITHPNADIAFHDPVNALGNWNNNSNYANLHTQSTRSGNTNGGCFSGGGMDDRFDFILVTNDVLDNDKGVEYIPTSYRALGQDGQRLNGTITSPANTQVPSAVSQALFDVSDHLPVMLDVRVLNLPVSAEEVRMPGVELTLRNPVQEHLELQLTAPGWQQADMAIYTLSGQLVNTQRLQPSPEGFQTSGITLEPGAYLLVITNEHGIQVNRKVIKT